MGFGARLRELWHIRTWVAVCLVLAKAVLNLLESGVSPVEPFKIAS